MQGVGVPHLPREEQEPNKGRWAVPAPGRSGGKKQAIANIYHHHRRKKKRPNAAETSSTEGLLRAEKNVMEGY